MAKDSIKNKWMSTYLMNLTFGGLSCGILALCDLEQAICPYRFTLPFVDDQNTYPWENGALRIFRYCGH